MTDIGIKKERSGVVFRKSSDKTIIVEVQRLVQDFKFKKYVHKRTRYHVHDPKNECQVGDFVKIVETRPVSKSKRWRLSEIIKKGELIEGDVI